MRIWDHRVIPQQWCNTCEVAAVSTWRQAGSLPLLAVFCSVFQGRTVGHQLSAGTVELKRVVVGCWIKRQSVESCKTDKNKMPQYIKLNNCSSLISNDVRLMTLQKSGRYIEKVSLKMLPFLAWHWKTSSNVFGSHWTPTVYMLKIVKYYFFKNVIGLDHCYSQ